MSKIFYKIFLEYFKMLLEYFNFVLTINKPMKKVIILTFLFVWNVGVAQTQFNPDSVNFYFVDLLNTYRHLNGLHSIYLNSKLKNFADTHVKYLASNHDKKIVHSIKPLANGDMNTFRKILDQYFGPNSYFVENIAASTIYEKSYGTEVGDYPYVDLKETYQYMLDVGPNNQILAKCAFLLWKNSPAHNNILLHKEIKGVYVSFDNHNDMYFFEFVGLNY